MEISIELFCSLCGTELDIVEERSKYGLDGEATIEPCSYCMNEKDIHIQNLETLLEDTENEVYDLTERIVELETED